MSMNEGTLEINSWLYEWYRSVTFKLHLVEFVVFQGSLRG